MCVTYAYNSDCLEKKIILDYMIRLICTLETTTQPSITDSQIAVLCLKKFALSLSFKMFIPLDVYIQRFIFVFLTFQLLHHNSSIGPIRFTHDRVGNKRVEIYMIECVKGRK